MVTWFSLAISITFRSVTAPRRMAYRGGGSRLSLCGGLAANDDLEPQHLVRQVERTLELGQNLGLGREFHHDVVALGLVLDLERQPAPAPSIDVADLAAGLADDPRDAIQCPGHDRFVGLRGQDEHAFVPPQFPTSSGLDGPHEGEQDAWLAPRVYRPAWPGDPNTARRHAGTPMSSPDAPVDSDDCCRALGRRRREIGRASCRERVGR